MKLLLVALLFLPLLAGAQTPYLSHPQFLKDRFLPGHYLVGAGLTGLGLELKAGTFVKEGLWAGLTAQVQAVGVFSQNAQAGLAGRYYLARGRDFSFFAGGGYAYGYFRVFEWSRDEVAKLQGEQAFFSGNLHGDLGADLWMSRHLSLEGAIRRSHLLRSGNALPGVTLAVNYFF